MITLSPVTPENYAAVLSLKVAPEQTAFVAPVVKSLADAYVYPAATAYAATEDGAVVGFVLLYPFEDESSPAMTLVRLLVDQSHQGRGLGTAILGAVVALAKESVPRPLRMRLSVFSSNVRAIRLYEQFGFAGEEIEDGERVMWLDL